MPAKEHLKLAINRINNMAIKIYCDNCQEEIRDFTFTFEALMRSVIKVSALINGNVQERPRTEEKRIHLCQKCYQEKFK